MKSAPEKSPKKSSIPGTLVKLRVVAVKTLAQVLHSSLSLDEALMSELTRNSATTKPEFDRSWIYEICSGVLRYKGRLDFIIDTYALKKKPTGPLRRYLYTAIYQMLAQDTPTALVVSEAVQAVKANEGEMPSKFANAILRKVSDSQADWKNWQITEKSPFAEQAAWCSLPEWLFKKLVKQHGFDFTKAFCLASLERPVTWYHNLESGESEILKDGFQGNEAHGFVQDISNQSLIQKVHEQLLRISSTLVGSLDETKPKILDLCAAPGGKSMALASLGWPIVATDKDSSRLQKVIENKSRLKFTDAQIKVEPFKMIWESDEKWAVIWLDVPCMSFGIMRRHPEIKWNRFEKDLPVLVQKQKELVDWAKKHLLPGGAIVYSTCSLLKEENPESILGLKCVEHYEWAPQSEPFGDGIIASVFTGE